MSSTQYESALLSLFALYIQQRGIWFTNIRGERKELSTDNVRDLRKSFCADLERTRMKRHIDGMPCMHGQKLSD